MESTAVLNELNDELTKLRGAGKNQVEIEELLRYIDRLKSHANVSTEHLKLEQQRSLAYLDVKTKHSVEMFKSVIEAGREALNALVLINGGSVVALLGFMGATIAKGFPSSLGAALTHPLLYFGLGVLMGAVGFGLRYLTQACYAYEKDVPGTVLNIGSILSAVVGYVLFGFGVHGAYRAFTEHFAN
ncbi:hypothetical protein [Comamonas aquatica]|uniref:hypothetical protein n=1 Tax=Comamonas aquatica TaxID=225991 RepID=UPI0024468A7B|nr:hypothetical protein [Comamonas aquatica]MDH0380634.1 hypothetical protein [Comamonas aquatica]MDH0429173.1 hypothetical protein [Comamonas aquatica]MDH0940047.1 hypothetical protein [Comamonas aquatica]